MKKVNILLGILYTNTLLLIIIFIAFYSSLISNNNNGSSDSWLPIIFFGVWFFSYILFSIINIVSLFIDYKNNNIKLLFKKMKRIKLGLIPFWIINFICYLPISIFLIVVGHGFGFIIVPIFIFASYTVLCLTSIFSVTYLKSLHKNGIITFKQCIIHSLLQFIFVIDIIDTIYIIRKWGKQDV